MHDVIVMQESNTLQQHDHVTFDLSWGKRSVGVPDDLRQVRQHEVKHQDEACTMREDILQLHYLKKKMKSECKVKI